MKTNRLFWALPIFALSIGTQAQARGHYPSFDRTNDYIPLPVSKNGLDTVPVGSVETRNHISFTSSDYNSNCAKWTDCSWGKSKG